MNTNLKFCNTFQACLADTEPSRELHESSCATLVPVAQVQSWHQGWTRNIFQNRVATRQEAPDEKYWRQAYTVLHGNAFFRWRHGVAPREHVRHGVLFLCIRPQLPCCCMAMDWMPIAGTVVRLVKILSCYQSFMNLNIILWMF